MKYFLSNDFIINFSKIKSSNHIPNFVFDCNSSVVALGSILDSELDTIIDNTVGSEHWVSEESDFFRFNENGKLNSIILSVPSEDRAFDNLDTVISSNEGFTALELEKNHFIIEPMKYRYFDYKKRFLFCFNQECIKNYTLTKAMVCGKKLFTCFYQ